MASLSSFISLNCDIFIYSIELFNDKLFVEEFNLSNLDPKNLFRSIFEVSCKGMVRLAEVGREKARRRDSSALSIFHFLSHSHECVLPALVEMGMELVCHGFEVGIAMSLYL